MPNYFLRLALNSFARNPGLSALMVFAIGIGIAVCVMMLTMYHAMAGNPIWWKNDRLYAVTMNSWTPERPPNRDRPSLPPTRLSDRDSTFLFNSDIPVRKVLMYKTNGVLRGGNGAEQRPLQITARVATADFFPMFEVPFQYGGSWNANADVGPEPVMVLSQELNEKLFGGANSVGRTLRWHNREFRIIGVLAHWHPLPKFYDVTSGAFDDPEEAYVPWGWGKALELRNEGTTSCWKVEPVNTFQEIVASECVWIQMWVELASARDRERMQAYMDAYWAEQRKSGRFPRPVADNRLTNVSQWLEDQEVVSDDNRLLVWLAFAFFGVCLINTVGLLLAKFLNGAPTSGIRRALGASRANIVVQHLVEVGILASAGSIAGLALCLLGLWGIRTLYGGGTDGVGSYSELAHFDPMSIVWILALAAIAALVAGLYPAWRIGRLPPANYLKSQ